MKEKIGIKKQETREESEEESKKIKEIKKTFHEYYPEGEIESAEIDKMPPEVQKHFERRSKLLVNEMKWRPENLEKFWVVNHDNGDQTYLAQEIKVLKRVVDEWTHFVSVREQESLIYGDFIKNLKCPEEYSEKYKDKLFALHIFLFRDESGEFKYKKSGFGERILDVMNAFGRAFYNLPLYLDTNISEDAKEFLNRLHEKGKLKLHKEVFKYTDSSTGKEKQHKYDRYVYK